MFAAGLPSAKYISHERIRFPVAVELSSDERFLGAWLTGSYGRDDIFVTYWLENLHRMIHEIERRLRREPWKHTRGSLSQLQPTREKQVQSIHELSKTMQELKPEVTEFIGYEPAIPLKEIETLLLLANE